MSRLARSNFLSCVLGAIAFQGCSGSSDPPPLKQTESPPTSVPPSTKPTIDGGADDGASDAGEDVIVAGEPVPLEIDPVCAVPYQGFDLGKMSPQGVAQEFIDAWETEATGTTYPGLVVRASGLIKRPGLFSAGAVNKPGTLAFDMQGTPYSAGPFSLSISVSETKISMNELSTTFFASFGDDSARRGFPISGIVGDLVVDVLCAAGVGNLTLLIPGTASSFAFGGSTVGALLGPVVEDTDGDTVADGWSLILSGTAPSINIAPEPSTEGGS